MIEALTGKTYPATVEGFDTGLATVGVRVLDANNVEVQARTVAGVTEIEAGSGIYSRVMPALDAAGVYRVVWDDGLATPHWGSEDVIVKASYQEPAPQAGYPLALDLVAQTSGEANALLAALTADQLGALYAQAIRDIEGFCQQKFGGIVNETRVLDGTGSRELPLPARLETLDSLEIRGFALGVPDVSLSEDHSVLRVTEFAVSNYYTRALRDILQTRQRIFPIGPGVVTVTGDWGWAECPQEVAIALRLDLEDLALSGGNDIASTIRAYQAMGVTSISQGPLHVTVGPAPPVSDRVAHLLADFVFMPSLGVLPQGAVGGGPYDF